MRKVFKLYDDFGLNPAQSQAQVKDLYGPEAAQQKYPQVYRRLKALSPTTADNLLMLLSAFDAGWMEAGWQGIGGGQNIDNPTSWLVSYNPIIVPPGYYMATIIPELSMGKYEGAGNGYSAPLSDAHNTTIGLWHEKWNGNPNEVHGFSSSTWGKIGGQYYAEGMLLRDMKVDARQSIRPNDVFNSTAFRLWQIGTGSQILRLRGDEARTAGFDFFNPTPADVQALTAMHNVQAAVLQTGGWGSTLTISCLEADNNAVAIEQREAYGYAAGGTLKAFIKGEDGVKPVGTVPARGQMAAILRGQFCADLQLQFTAKNEMVDALVMVDPMVGTNQPQVSNALIHGKSNVESGQGYRTLVQQLHNPLTGGGGFWTIPDKRAFRVEYSTDGGGVVSQRGKDLVKTPSTLTKRRGAVPMGGAYAGDTPAPEFAYIIGPGTVAPPVTPPVTPVDPPPVVDPPPSPGSGIIETMLNVINTSPSVSRPVDWKGVKRFKFTNLKLLIKPNYQRLAWKNASDNGLRIDEDGQWRMPGSATMCPQTPKPMAENVVYPTAEIVLTAPTDFQFFLSKPGVGAALQFSCDKLEVLSV